MSRRRSQLDERGQTTLMIVGFAGVLFMLLAVVVDASAAYLQRQGLATIADGAALAGADAGATGEEVYEGGFADDGRARQGTEAAEAAVAAYLADVDAHRRYPGLTFTTLSPTAAWRCACRRRSTCRCSCPVVRATRP